MGRRAEIEEISKIVITINNGVDKVYVDAGRWLGLKRTCIDGSWGSKTVACVFIARLKREWVT